MKRIRAARIPVLWLTAAMSYDTHQDQRLLDHEQRLAEAKAMIDRGRP